MRIRFFLIAAVTFAVGCFGKTSEPASAPAPAPSPSTSTSTSGGQDEACPGGEMASIDCCAPCTTTVVATGAQGHCGPNVSPPHCPANTVACSDIDATSHCGSVGAGATEIVVEQDILGGPPCSGTQNPWGRENAKVAIDLTTSEVTLSKPDCSGDAGTFSAAWVTVEKRIATSDEIDRVRAALQQLHEGPHPDPCAYDGPLLSLQITSPTGTVRYQDQDLNCYKRPDVHYTVESLRPIYDLAMSLVP